MTKKLFLVLCLILSSCGDERLRNDPSQSIIDGVWESSCEGDGGTTVSSRLEFSFAEKFERIDTQWDATCGEAQYYLRSLGSYELEATWEADTYRIQLDLMDRAIRMFDPESANQSEVCDFQFWSQAEIEVQQLNLSHCPFSISGAYQYVGAARLGDSHLSLISGNSQDAGPQELGSQDLSGVYIRAH